MIKLAMIAGLFAVLGFSGIGFDTLVSGVFAVAIGFLVLAMFLQIAAVVFESITRRWIGVAQHGNSVRMSGSRSVV